jgi:glycosyltransferase 2 family protein
MKLDWKGAAGIVISAALLWWALHGINFGEVWATLRRSNVPLFLASSAVSTMVVPIRARRWRPILDPVALHLPFGMLWRATAIGLMVNNVVPARVGELMRAYALTRETPRVPLPAAIASVAVDRLFDGLVVLCLTLAAMLMPSFPSHARVGSLSAVRWALIGLGLMAALMVALYAIVFFPSWLMRAYELVARRLAPRLEAPGRRALQAFADGLSVLRHGPRFAAVFGWATLLWLTNAFAFWLAFRAVGVSAPFSAALFVQGVVALGVAVPSAPGFFGVFEVAAIVGFAVYGLPKDVAVTWAIGYHIVSFIPITLIGMWYFARLGLHLSDVRTAEEGDFPATKLA